jgi:putative transposase
LLDVAIDLARSKSELVLENALLRQQLIILRRQVKRPKLTWRDGMLFVLSASKLHSWKQVLVIVRPETLLRDAIARHRDPFRWVWKRKSRSKGNSGRPPLSEEVVALIKQMAQDSFTWGAKRIRGELLKLGLQVSKNTIRKYIKCDHSVRPGRTGRRSCATTLARYGSATFYKHTTNGKDV